MLTVSKASAGHAGHYYTADMPGQSKLDSQWVGKATEDLGLSGSVDADLFRTLMHGVAPNGEPLAQRGGISRRPGIEITFSAPKSVSLEAICNENILILEAHRRAISLTFDKIEQEAQTRQMVQGKVRFISTGNLVAASFEHTLNRHNDPQLHTHVVIINATRYKDQWRSFYARKLFQKIKAWGQFYRDRLAELLIEAGYQLRTSSQEFWELSCVPKAVIKRFSRRRSDIISTVGKDSTSAQKQYACLMTRPNKKAVPLEVLRKRWKQEIGEVLALRTSEQDFER